VQAVALGGSVSSVARSVTIAAVITVTLGACGPSGAPSSRPASTTAGTPAPAPTATSGPEVAERFEFGADAVVDTTLAGTSDLYINPGAVIDADGVLHMFPNLFSMWPGRVRVPHLTSVDGVAWTLDADAPPLDSEDVALADPGIDVSTGFIGDDGTWILVFETVSASKPWLLARATAPGPQGPWAVEEVPILTPGAAGTFDAGGLHWPSVARVGNRWAMFYAGFDQPQGGTGSIGVAFWNGATWDKHPEPVLVATERWEGRSVDRPRVVATPEGLVMVYAGRDLTDRGIATSQDGLTWTKVPGPNIEQSDFPVRQRAWDAALIHRAGRLEYFLEIGSGRTQVYRATLAWP
jgi:hypothetical protein